MNSWHAFPSTTMTLPTTAHFRGAGGSRAFCLNHLTWIKCFIFSMESGEEEAPHYEADRHGSPALSLVHCSLGIPVTFPNLMK